MRIHTSSLRLGFYLLAFGLALASNYLFTGEWLTRFDDVSSYVWGWRQSLGSGLLVASVVVAAWCFGRRDDFEAGAVASAEAGSEGMVGLKCWQDWLGLAPSLVCHGVATWLYVTKGESSLVRWLWLASVVVLLAPYVRKSRMTDFGKFQFWEYGVLALIAAAAFTMRYVDLVKIPYHVSNDTAIMGLFSRQMLEAGDGRWVGMAQQTNHQFSEHQLLVLGMRLFGVGHYGLSMLSVIAGTVSVVAVHYLGRILFNRWVGLIAASFLAIDYVHVHFSRIVFGPITTCFVLLGAVFLMHGIKRNSRLGFALGGVGFGMGLLGRRA